MKEITSVAIIGAGNVGTRLALAFHGAGIKIDQICSNTVRHGKQLSKLVDANFIHQVSELEGNSGCYLFCIPDQNIASIKKYWALGNCLLVHTAGTTSIDILRDFSENYGVFYPLQTFSRDHKLSFSNLPLCIEANNEKNRKLLKSLAGKISNNVRILDSEQRRWAHLAAVIASNFSNYMYQVAEDILKEKGLDFELIHPLILETARKAGRIGPHNSQTGPATRGDHNTIRTHMEMLKEFPGYQKFYEVLTNSILEEYQKL